MAHKRIDSLTAADIEQRVSKAKSGCWEWRGSHFQMSGYGRIKMAGRTYVAHRVVYEALVGPIPEGLDLDHLCRNRCCVNPAHLEPVTPRTNVLRGQTVVAANHQKTHCPKGHALSGDNLFIRRDGRRRCRTCERASQARLRAKPATKQRHAEEERRRRAKAKEKT